MGDRKILREYSCPTIDIDTAAIAMPATATALPRALRFGIFEMTKI